MREVINENKQQIINSIHIKSLKTVYIDQACIDFEISQCHGEHACKYLIMHNWVCCICVRLVHTNQRLPFDKRHYYLQKKHNEKAHRSGTQETLLCKCEKSLVLTGVVSCVGLRYNQRIIIWNWFISMFTLRTYAFNKTFPVDNFNFPNVNMIYSNCTTYN